MLDTVASNKTAQVTLGVLQKPQSTIVNYYCIVNCYYFVSLVVPSVMTCIATLSAVMRWVFVHYLSGEQVLRLITELTEWQGLWDKRLAKRWIHHKLVARSTAKGLLLAVLHSWEKTSCPSTVSSSFFFFTLIGHSSNTPTQTHIHIYERQSFSCPLVLPKQLSNQPSVSPSALWSHFIWFSPTLVLWGSEWTFLGCRQCVALITLLCAVFGLWILTAL